MRKEYNLISIGKQIIEDEIKGLQDLKQSIDLNFHKVIKKIIHSSGRVIVSGIGKSGYVARKISSTFSSTGTPSLFVHPTEASHGDLGMITKNDIMILLSNSGDTYELNTIIDYCKILKVYIIGVTRKDHSVLSAMSDLPIILPNSHEASDIEIPSTSVVMMIAYFDAITIVLQKIRKFSQDDFKTLHPGGKIGARLLTVSKLMHKNESIPSVFVHSSGIDIIREMTTKGFGCTAVLDTECKLIGIVTDVDLRKNIEKNWKSIKAKDIMSHHTCVVDGDTCASQVLFIMSKNNMMCAFVVKDHKLVGIVHMYDLVKAGIA